MKHWIKDSLSLTENSSWLLLLRTPALRILPHVVVIPANKYETRTSQRLLNDFSKTAKRCLIDSVYALPHLLRSAQSAWFPSVESGGVAQNCSSANSASCTWLGVLVSPKQQFKHKETTKCNHFKTWVDPCSPSAPHFHSSM